MGMNSRADSVTSLEISAWDNILLRKEVTMVAHTAVELEWELDVVKHIFIILDKPSKYAVGRSPGDVFMLFSSSRDQI